MNFYKRWIGDYMRDTSHLSLIEHGAYTKLLDQYYASGKPLPKDLIALYRITGCQDMNEKMAIEKIANEFFPVTVDGLRHNSRADTEIAQYGVQVETNRRITREREGKRNVKRFVKRSV